MSFGKLVTVTVAGGTGMNTITLAIISMVPLLLARA